MWIVHFRRARVVKGELARDLRRLVVALPPIVERQVLFKGCGRDENA